MHHLAVVNTLTSRRFFHTAKDRKSKAKVHQLWEHGDGVFRHNADKGFRYRLISPYFGIEYGIFNSKYSDYETKSTPIPNTADIVKYSPSFFRGELQRNLYDQ
jgi:hypothetical protein